MQKFKLIYVPFLLTMIVMFILVSNNSNLRAMEKDQPDNVYLGVKIDQLSSTLKKQLGIDHGVVVNWVEQNSPAEKAGIEEDDIILEVNGKVIRRPSTLVRSIRKFKPEQKISIALYKDGKKKTVSAVFSKQKQRSRHCGVTNGCYLYSFQDSPYLGIKMQDLNNDLAAYFAVESGKGVLIVNVFEDSPAGDAGLKAGDVIITIDNEEISRSGDVHEILADFEPGDDIAMEVIRQKKKQLFTATLEDCDQGGYHFNIQPDAGIYMKKNKPINDFHIFKDNGMHQHMIRNFTKYKDTI